MAMDPVTEGPLGTDAEAVGIEAETVEAPDTTPDETVPTSEVKLGTDAVDKARDGEDPAEPVATTETPTDDNSDAAELVGTVETPTEDNADAAGADPDLMEDAMLEDPTPDKAEPVALMTELEAVRDGVSTGEIARGPTDKEEAVGATGTDGLATDPVGETKEAVFDATVAPEDEDNPEAAGTIATLVDPPDDDADATGTDALGAPPDSNPDAVGSNALVDPPEGDSDPAGIEATLVAPPDGDPDAAERDALADPPDDEPDAAGTDADDDPDAAEPDTLVDSPEVEAEAAEIDPLVACPDGDPEVDEADALAVSPNGDPDAAGIDAELVAELDTDPDAAGTDADGDPDVAETDALADPPDGDPDAADSDASLTPDSEIVRTPDVVDVPSADPVGEMTVGRKPWKPTAEASGPELAVDSGANVGVEVGMTLPDPSRAADVMLLSGAPVEPTTNPDVEVAARAGVPLTLEEAARLSCERLELASGTTAKPDRDRNRSLADTEVRLLDGVAAELVSTGVGGVVGTLLPGIETTLGVPEDAALPAEPTANVAEPEGELMADKEVAGGTEEAPSDTVVPGKELVASDDEASDDEDATELAADAADPSGELVPSDDETSDDEGGTELAPNDAAAAELVPDSTLDNPDPVGSPTDAPEVPDAASELAADPVEEVARDPDGLAEGPRLPLDTGEAGMEITEEPSVDDAKVVGGLVEVAGDPDGLAEGPKRPPDTWEAGMEITEEPTANGGEVVERLAVVPMLLVGTAVSLVDCDAAELTPDPMTDVTEVPPPALGDESTIPDVEAGIGCGAEPVELADDKVTTKELGVGNALNDTFAVSCGEARSPRSTISTELVGTLLFDGIAVVEVPLPLPVSVAPASAGAGLGEERVVVEFETTANEAPDADKLSATGREVTTDDDEASAKVDVTLEGGGRDKVRLMLDEASADWTPVGGAGFVVDELVTVEDA
ncbi:MAG: hypothetical protein M1826_006006 [Phylliscum demangeonii]|nr:MAG: hypothetical protein M1826_006006 [Phylliscum demangeonii]